MDPHLPKCFDQGSYLKKLRTEVNAIKILTETVSSEISEKCKDNKALKKKLNPNIDFVYVSITWTDKFEEFYSRIATFLQTLSLFISISSDTTHRPPVHRLINSPKVCSLPTLCRMLWKQVESFCRESDGQNLIRTHCSTDASVAVTMSSKSNQTESSCLRYCESCQLSTGLIRMLVNQITEEQKKYCVGKTHVSEFKRQVVDDVVEMSQWGAMSGWVKAIQEDMKWASEMVALSQKHNLSLTSTLYKIKEEQKSTQKKLKNDLQLVQTQLAAEKAQNCYLRHQIEDLNLSLKRRKEYEQSLQEHINKQSRIVQLCQRSTNALKSEIGLTKNLHNAFKDFVNTKLSSELREIKNLNGNTTRTLQKMLDISCASLDKQADFKAELEEKNEIIDVLQKKCVVFEQQQRTQNEDIVKLEAMIKKKIQEENNMQQKVEQLETSLEESKAQELLYKSRLESATQTQIKFSGDPVQDMETQRQRNKRQMKRLLKENADLKSTIQKLKARRENLQIYTKSVE